MCVFCSWDEVIFKCLDAHPLLRGCNSHSSCDRDKDMKHNFADDCPADLFLCTGRIKENFLRKTQMGWWQVCWLCEQACVKISQIVCAQHIQRDSIKNRTISVLFSQKHITFSTSVWQPTSAEESRASRWFCQIFERGTIGLCSGDRGTVRGALVSTFNGPPAGIPHFPTSSLVKLGLWPESKQNFGDTASISTHFPSPLLFLFFLFLAKTTLVNISWGTSPPFPYALWGDWHATTAGRAIRRFSLSFEFVLPSSLLLHHPLFFCRRRRLFQERVWLLII